MVDADSDREVEMRPHRGALGTKNVSVVVRQVTGRIQAERGHLISC